MPPIQSPAALAATFPAPPPAAFGTVADLAILRFDGADAASFLQGQLSSDVRALVPGALQLSSYNSPKGRMLASLVLARPAADGSYLAVLAADLAVGIGKRLSMFVLRARVSVGTGDLGRTLLGVTGTGCRAAVAAALGVDLAPGFAQQDDDRVTMALPDGRILVELTHAHAPDIGEALALHARHETSEGWSRAGVEAGVPLVTAATSDRFVPQALNWDALGGIGFQKGCYPGQEIVARMQYLGRLKERLYAFTATGAPPPAGARLFAAAFDDQACGTVVNSAALSAGGALLLAVVQRVAAEEDIVHVGAPDGPALTRRALPYPVPEPAAPRGRLA